MIRLCLIALARWQYTITVIYFFKTILHFRTKDLDGENESIGHVRYINILTWLRGFEGKLLYLVLFSLYPSLFWELGDKRNFTKLQV